MNTIAELRVLVFGLSDIKMAIDLADETLAVSIPDKEIIELIGSDDEEVTILFKNTPGIHEPGIEIQEKDLIESLVALCISRKIPLPRNARKTIQVKHNAISMWIESGESIDTAISTEIGQKLK